MVVGHGWIMWQMVDFVKKSTEALEQEEHAKLGFSTLERASIRAECHSDRFRGVRKIECHDRLDGGHGGRLDCQKGRIFR